MHKTMVGNKQRSGFSIVELIIVIVVIAILATIGVVAYNGVQRRSADTMVRDALSSANKAVQVEVTMTSGVLTALPSNVRTNDSVKLTLVEKGPHYSNMTAVQNGTLFNKVCNDLLADPSLTTIHGTDGATDTYFTGCNQSTSGNSMQITSWSTQNLTTPVTQANIQTLVDNAPSSGYWADQQQVVQNFYTTLMNKYSAQGGTWPITSFWDSWANQWSGVPAEALPSADPIDPDDYCIEAQSTKYSDIVYKATGADSEITPGKCY